MEGGERGERDLGRLPKRREEGEERERDMGRLRKRWRSRGGGRDLGSVWRRGWEGGWGGVGWGGGRES